MRRLLRSGSLPVRWRVAAASAALTFVILVVFALVIGRFATERLYDDFDQELRAAAGTLAAQVQVSDSDLGPVIRSPRLEDYAMAKRAFVRIVDASGQSLDGTPGFPELEPPSPGVRNLGGLRVATVPVVAGAGILDAPPVFVQYGQTTDDLDATIARLRFFLLLGVLGGTFLAAFAGLAVADRAMRPIGSLTATAREIAATRDPSRRMPEPQTDDEVGELARTLAEMLRSLDASRHEREEAMLRQREFVADASHELRTPLTSVLANLELLAESLERDPEDAEAVDSALASTRRMRRLVSDLLLLARADAGRAAARSRCDLAGIAAEARAEVEPLASAHELDAEVDGPLPVDGNADELHRLIVNLLDNAIRHTPAGTRVRLTARAEDGMALIAVEDAGPGLPAGSEAQAFERFSRPGGSADTSPHGPGGGGTGLGLAIVRAVAESHQGAASVDSSPLGGARFSVTLPLADDAGDGAPAPERGAPGAGHPAAPTARGRS